MSTEEGRRAYCREDLIFQVTQLICKIMKEKPVTRKELADIVGVTKGHITQLLSGNHNMTLVTISDLFYALGCKITLEASPCTVESFADAVTCQQKDEWETISWTVPTEEPKPSGAPYKFAAAA
jgi:transcriptional regulator with XRE-family HTH domain